MKSNLLFFLSSSENSFVFRYLMLSTPNPFKLTFSYADSIYLTNSADLYGIIMIALSNIASFSSKLSLAIVPGGNKDP